MSKDIAIAEKYLKKVEDAKKRNIKFDLSLTSFKNIQRAKKCYFTGIELTDVPNLANSRTIDRIDPTKGYEKGNVVACSFAANYFKSKIEIDNGLNPNQLEKVLKKCNNLKVIGVKGNREVDNFDNSKKLNKILDKQVIKPSSNIVYKPIPFSGSREHDLTGKIKGKFKVIGYNGNSSWILECECGHKTTSSTPVVKSNYVHQCPECD